MDLSPSFTQWPLGPNAPAWETTNLGSVSGGEWRGLAEGSDIEGEKGRCHR